MNSDSPRIWFAYMIILIITLGIITLGIICAFNADFRSNWDEASDIELEVGL